MSQSRTLSLAEAGANVILGYVLAVLTQIVVFPWFGIEVALQEHLAIGLAFAGMSLLRGYLLRRLFERLRRPEKWASTRLAQSEAERSGTGKR